MNIPTPNPAPFSMLDLAKAFSARIRLRLGADLAEVIRRNRDEINPSVCHSHDFLDANVVMLDALESELRAHDQSLGTCPVDDIAQYAGLMDAAWMLARQHHFTL